MKVEERHPSIVGGVARRNERDMPVMRLQKEADLLR